MRRVGLILMLIVLVGIAVSSAQTTPCKATQAKDPVCGLCVEKDPKLSVSYKGETFYFCTNKDADTFKESPAKWANKR